MPAVPLALGTGAPLVEAWQALQEQKAKKQTAQTARQQLPCQQLLHRNREQQ